MIRGDEGAFSHLDLKDRGQGAQVGEPVADGCLAGKVEIALDGRAAKGDLAIAREADGGRKDGMPILQRNEFGSSVAVHRRTAVRGAEIDADGCHNSQ